MTYQALAILLAVVLLASINLGGLAAGIQDQANVLSVSPSPSPTAEVQNTPSEFEYNSESNAKVNSNPEDSLKAITQDVNSFAKLPAVNASPPPIPEEITLRIHPPELDAKAAVLYDLNRGASIFEKKPDQTAPIASLTKLMTALIVEEDFATASPITISPEDLNVSEPKDGLKAGDALTVREALHVMLVGSNNAVAMSLARNLMGVPQFVNAMNARAKALGMVNTHFTDPAGLDDQNSWSTSRDVMKLALYIYNNHDDIFSITHDARITILTVGGRPIAVANTDELLPQYPQIIGGKTGYTDLAGGCLLLVFEAGSHQYISIVLGSSDRFGDSQKIIDYARETSVE